LGTGDGGGCDKKKDKSRTNSHVMVWMEKSKHQNIQYARRE
jgi:hypothetical protein